jgi:lysyl-tRNA synthetase class 2
MERRRGRVIEARRQADRVELLILEEDRSLAALASPEVAAGVAAGDLVELDLDGPVARRVERLGGPAPEAWDPEGDALRWRRPGSGPSRIARLRQRHAILRAIRDDLDGHGFLEVQAPLLVRGACPDLHIDSFAAEDRTLVTSTEYQLKRLVVGGCERVFTLTQNFRRGDLGAQHNPEFTMLEWARAYEDLDAIEDDAERLVRGALRALGAGAGPLRYGGHAIDLHGRFRRVSVRAALEERLGVRVAGDFALDSMLDGARQAGIDVPEAARGDAHEVFSYLLVLLQPHLGTDVPVFLQAWPSFMTSSAAVSEANAAEVDRSELFIAGIEIADGFPSLRDPLLQERLFERELSRRGRGRAVALDQRYLEALRQGLPPGAGMALGVDRLTMVLTGAATIREVLPFAWDEL